MQYPSFVFEFFKWCYHWIYTKNNPLKYKTFFFVNYLHFSFLSFLFVLLNINCTPLHCSLFLRHERRNSFFQSQNILVPIKMFSQQNVYRCCYIICNQSFITLIIFFLLLLIKMNLQKLKKIILLILTSDKL